MRLGTLMPFEQVPEALAFFTQVGIGKETARRVTERMGEFIVEIETEEADRLEREAPAAPAGPPVQQVSVDGAMVPLVGGGWTEVKTLAIGTVEADKEGKAHTTALSYFSRLAEAERFYPLAELELHRRGTAHAGTICAIVDGADWCQGFIDVLCPRAVRILDFPHAAEHLASAAHAVYGPGTSEASEWLGVHLHELKHGDPDAVLAALRALPATTTSDAGQAARTRDGVLNYFEKRRDQLNYAQFQAAGYPIGSGIVESANKLVVEARLKGSGMHWGRRNVNPMVGLRATYCSGRWGELWAAAWTRFSARPRRALRERPMALPSPATSVEENRSAQPASKATSPPREPLIRLERKGLAQNGRPTKDHPWRRALVSRPRPAKIPSAGAKS